MENRGESSSEARARSERQREEKLRRDEERKAAQKVVHEKTKKMVQKLKATPFWEKWGDPIGYTVIGLVVVSLIVINYTGDRRRPSDIPVNEDVFIQAHNEDKGRGYKLEKTAFFEGLSLQSVRDLLKNNIAPKKVYTKCDMSALASVTVPESYNFYTEFPQCRREEVQRKCASAYVEIPLSVYRDRACATGAEGDFRPALDYFLNCNKKASGCKGGALTSTLAFMRKSFVGQDCWERIADPEAKDACPTDKLKTCDVKTIDAYCHLEGVNTIKREIKQNGPVISVMSPFRDFFVYKSGSYVPEDRGRVEGLLFVKVVGWETDSDLREYWLVENLWGADWGQQGIARVKIGAEDVMIDQYAFTLYIQPADATASALRGKPEAYVEED